MSKLDRQEIAATTMILECKQEVLKTNIQFRQQIQELINTANMCVFLGNIRPMRVKYPQLFKDKR